MSTMSTNEIDNFLESLTQQETGELPFNQKESSQPPASKLNFVKVQAKNFRSVGPEWMSLDLQSKQSTLVVSDDNGAGKSTMCVWAPYFALTGKPYSPKEKIGALVNSMSAKGAEVVLWVNTRGRNYKIHRGYKPAIFEIYIQDENTGEWARHEARAGSNNQQADLEEMLGVDPSMLEKTIVLGLDKFQPFVSMDAANRRHMVERIWDLGVFSRMLDTTKANISTLNRDLSTLSVEIDKSRERARVAEENIHTVQGFEQHHSKLLTEIHQLKQAQPSLESRIVKSTSHSGKQLLMMCLVYMSIPHMMHSSISFPSSSSSSFFHFFRSPFFISQFKHFCPSSRSSCSHSTRRCLFGHSLTHISFKEYLQKSSSEPKQEQFSGHLTGSFFVRSFLITISERSGKVGS